MRLILSEILTLRQHLNTLKQTPELYCPDACIYCQETLIWRYGYYYRKPDRLNHGDASQNDIPIPRFKCVTCRPSRDGVFYPVSYVYSLVHRVYFVIQGVLKVNNGMRISRPLMGLMFNVFVMINVMDGVKYPVQQQLLFCIAPVMEWR